VSAEVWSIEFSFKIVFDSESVFVVCSSVIHPSKHSVHQIPLLQVCTCIARTLHLWGMTSMGVMPEATTPSTVFLDGTKDVFPLFLICQFCLT